MFWQGLSTHAPPRSWRRFDDVELDVRKSVAPVEIPFEAVREPAARMKIPFVAVRNPAA